MDSENLDITNLMNNTEIKELATDATYLAFPEEVFSFLTNDNFNKQLEEAPLLVLVYSSAVKAYKQNNEKNKLLEDFPDLMSLFTQDSETALYFRAQVNSANEEYVKLGSTGLLNNVNDGYLKNSYSSHISLIANYGLEWQEKSANENLYREDIHPHIDLNDKLTTMAAENYGEFLGEHYKMFDGLMQKPALTIAMAVYTQIFMHQHHQKQPPAIEEMQVMPEILTLEKGILNPQTMADKVPGLAKDMDPYDALVPLLNEVRENPQNFFTKEGFTNTTQFDKIQLNLTQQAKSGDYLYA